MVKTQEKKVKLYALMFAYPFEGNDLIGVFATKEEANAFAYSEGFDDGDREYMEILETELGQSAKSGTYYELVEAV